jgi:hypothetical protein
MTMRYLDPLVTSTPEWTRDPCDDGFQDERTVATYKGFGQNRILSKLGLTGCSKNSP